jgi:hypothetical protein
MTQITLIKNTPRNVTLFVKKKQNGEGGLPPSPPHLLLARENRFYYFVSIIMKGERNDRREARSREKRVYETTSESDVRGERRAVYRVTGGYRETCWSADRGAIPHTPFHKNADSTLSSKRGRAAELR